MPRVADFTGTGSAHDRIVVPTSGDAAGVLHEVRRAINLRHFGERQPTKPQCPTEAGLDALAVKQRNQQRDDGPICGKTRWRPKDHAASCRVHIQLISITVRALGDVLGKAGNESGEHGALDQAGARAVSQRSAPG
jgi:hypothetical protein